MLSKVAIIGGGISGLATAWWLHKAGIDVLVLERGTSVGGTIQTIRKKGWLIETGPNSALETTPLFRTLFEDLSLSKEVIYANDVANNRYILREGTLHPLPMTPGAFFRSGLWSTKGKLRLLKEPFFGRSIKEETIAEFVERRLGREFLDYAIDPFVAGVYAGNPEQLSVRAAFPKLFALEEKYGGLIRGQILGRRERMKRSEQSKDRASMFSFRSGMDSFPAAFHSALGRKVMTETIVRQIVKKKTKGQTVFKIGGTVKGKEFSCTANAVVTAIPSAAAAKLLTSFDKTLSNSLKNIYYPPVVEVFLGIKTSEIGRPLDGFGFLVPARENRRILGTIWSSTLFPGRAPDGYAALTTFVGGSRQPEFVEKSDQELTRIVLEELGAIMGAKGMPAFRHISRWKHAIPQYSLGHLAIIAEIERFEERHSGLFVSGNFRGGISVGDCVINSEVVASRVKTFMEHRNNPD